MKVATNALSLGLALAAALAASTACSIIDAPTQCASDADCARFGARCNVAQAVCVASQDDSSSHAYGAPLDAGASTKPAPTASPVEAGAPTTTQARTEIVDAGRDAAASDAAPAALAPTIQCGDTTCPAGGDSVCCIGAAGPACAKAADCADAPVACDDTEDCAGTPGTICCAFNDGNGAQPTLLRSSCVAPDQCDANGPQDQMCNPNDPATQCDTATPGHGECKPFTYANATYSFCAVP
jgi:hypothetical protein